MGVGRPLSLGCCEIGCERRGCQCSVWLLYLYGKCIRGLKPREVVCDTFG
jgi:hypothetical protein